MIKNNSLSVFFGRFQPPHIGHLKVIEHALMNCDEVLVIIGSANERSSLRNPFTISQRKNMINDMIKINGLDHKRVKFDYLEDYLYNDIKWIIKARTLINNNNPLNKNVYLTGYAKDNSSYYLKLFPDYKELPYTNHYLEINSTDIRNALYNKTSINPTLVSPLLLNDSSIQTTINDLIDNKRTSIVDFSFTLLNVIVSSGCIVLNYNKDKSLYSLPEYNFDLTKSLLELSLEKGSNDIHLTSNILQARLKEVKTFDDVYRYDKQRRLSNGYYYLLNNHDSLPKIKNKLFLWKPINELKRDMFLNDHFHIINYFINFN